MSTTHTPRDKDRTWWSVSGKPGKDTAVRSLGRDASHKSGKLGSLASAFGLKSKKPSVLAIQGPVQAAHPTPVRPPPHYTNRPPSKSVSTVTSNDSLGPQTPALRNSLLTLSDSDPFAAQSPGAQDPSRLSVYSAVSMSDHIPRRNDDRSSASSSSLSFGADLSLEERSPRSRTYSSKRPGNAPLPRKISVTQPYEVPLEAMRSRTESILQPPEPYRLGLVKSGSSSTLHADKNRLSQPEPIRLLRPQMRARGNTDAGPVWPSENTFGGPPTPPLATKPTNLVARARAQSSTQSPPSSQKPKVIIRQPSTSRVGPSRVPPPVHRLPPPPGEEEVLPLASLEFSNPNHSSSSLSFSSSSNDGNRRRLALKGKQRTSDLDPFDVYQQSPFSGPSVGDKTLRKAVSHHSFTHKLEPSYVGLYVSTPPEEGKAPRKQRSFHHPRLPMPSLPSLPHRAPEPERRGSAPNASTPQRKRLFSGSNIRRPSTATTLQDDDARSVFSLPPERGLSSNPFGMAETVRSSFWDEGPSPSDYTGPPTPVVSEYTPQQIMSPAEMLKVEASVMDSEVTAQRLRSASFASTNTSHTGHSETDLFTQSLSPPPLSPRMIAKRILPLRSSSMVGKAGPGAYSRVIRPSTSQANMAPGFAEDSTPLGNLAPPSVRPRTAQRASAESLSTPPPLVHTHQSSGGPANRMSIVPIFPLSPPPPLQRVRSKTTSSERTVSNHSTSSGVPRRTLMKKPSFLNIEDEVDHHHTAVVHLKRDPAPVESSFLSFARESFDSYDERDDRL